MNMHPLFKCIWYLHNTLMSQKWWFQMVTTVQRASMTLCPCCCLAGVGPVIGVNPLLRCSWLEAEEKLWETLDPFWVQAHTHAHKHTHHSGWTSAPSPVHSAASVPRSTTRKPALGDDSCDNPVFSDPCFHGRNPTVDLVAGNLRWSTDQENLLYDMYSKL